MNVNNNHPHQQTHKNENDRIKHYQELLNNRECILDEDTLQNHNDLHVKSSDILINKPTRGWIPDLSNAESKQQALHEAFKYRGDITITMTDQTMITGYVFDRRIEKDPDNSYLRIIPTGSPDKKIKIRYNQIIKIEFTGKDTAEGKSWKHYQNKQSMKTSD